MILILKRKATMIKQIIDYPFLQFGALEIEYIGKRRWKVVKDFKFAIDRTNDVITIPKGFVTNLCSIPRIAYTLFPRSVKNNLAGCVHDYLYSIGYETRKVSDLIFKDILGLSDVTVKRYKKMFTSVRLFGSFFYKAVNK